MGTPTGGRTEVTRSSIFATIWVVAPFGETVLAWRLARGLTQAALARKARLPRPNLSAIERGDREVTLKTLRALAVALELRPGQLADGELPRDGATPLSRAGLERIAQAAVRGAVPSDCHEAALASALGRATSGRQRVARVPLAPGRGGDRAYFRLRTTMPANVVVSLIDRVGNDLERR